MKYRILALFFILFPVLPFSFSPFLLSAIEVGGHLTEDTTWSPVNNPYHVTGVIYVDADVTLTILPGTIIKFNDALLNYINNDEFCFIAGEEPLVKMIWCNGKIIAEGTDEDNIIFTRINEIDNYHWGCIYFPSNADLSVFTHCQIKYSAFIGTNFDELKGAFVVENGYLVAENCTFNDNITAIQINGYSYEILIIKCNFQLIGPLLSNVYYRQISCLDWDGFDTQNVLIAQNSFNTKMLTTGISASFVYNYGNCDPDLEPGSAIQLSSHYGGNYIFNNTFENYSSGIHGGEIGSSIYIKENQFTLDGGDGINIEDAYIEISENFLWDGNIFIEYSLGKMFNNELVNGEIWPYGNVQVSNNICYDSDGYGLKVGYNPLCSNNISICNQYAIWGKTVTYDNCIIIINEELTQHYVSGDPVFRNCIIDFPLDPPLIDGGGNIIVDSLQAQSIFEDILNGDFHLIEGSIAIDAGFDTLGYYYPFDMDYNHRIWDGNGNGTAIIDIGPYEYGAPALGGIEGVTYNPINSEPVDYVLIKINNEPSDFTFSDSIGSYQYKLPAGNYDVYAERVFYDDTIEYQVEVIDGQFTQLFIPMNETVDVEEHTIPNSSFQISHLTNYPNPFNPSTTISFSVPQTSPFAKIEIYNLKGQKVKILESVNSFDAKAKNSLSHYSVTWNGTDQNNKPVSSGIYLYKVKAGNQESVKRMLLLK